MNFSFLKHIFSKSSLIAVHIGDTCVEVLKANSKKGIVGYAGIELSKDVSEPVLKEAFLKADISEKDDSIILSLPESKIFSEHFVLPVYKDKKNFENDLFNKAQEIIPINLKNSYCDYLIRKSDDKIHVLFMAAEKKMVNRFLQMFNNLNIKPSFIGSESVSLGCALLNDDVRESGTVILNINSSAVICAIFGYDNKLEFTTTIPVIKGSDDVYLTDEIKKAISYYENKYLSSTDSILVTGDLSLFPDLLKKLEKVTKKKAEIKNTNEEKTKSGFFNNSANFSPSSSIAGLILQVLNNSADMNINLLDSGGLASEKKPESDKNEESSTKKIQIKTQSVFLKFLKRFLLISAKYFKRFYKISLIVLIILSVSVASFMFIKSSRERKLAEEYGARIEVINQKIQSAAKSDDVLLANETLDKAENEISNISEAEYFKDEILLLPAKIRKVRDEVNSVKRFKDIDPYIDFSLSDVDIEALGFLAINDSFFVYDKNTLYSAYPDFKSITDTNGIVAGTVMDDTETIVILTESGRIAEYDNGKFALSGSGKQGSDIKSFSKFLYLLAPAENQIYKYTKTRSGYSAPFNYNLNADLKGSISFAIDGSVYILKEGGDIVKIFKSEKQEFNIDGMIEDTSGFSRIFTSYGLKHLYLADPASNRIIILEKTETGARYISQMVFEELDIIQDVYVNDDENKMFLLTNKSIYQIDI